MRKRIIAISAAAASMILMTAVTSEACTGITLRSGNGSYVVARTIEWGGSNLNSTYAVVPRGHIQYSLIPGGGRGMKFAAEYGYVGLAVETEDFITEGLNEAGLSAGLFYFPGYGSYEEYGDCNKDSNIADLQLVPFILGSCSTIDEVIETINSVHIINIDPRASTAHWRFADKSGRQIVLEVIDNRHVFYENTLGVLTNSPSFDWHMTNLNNYVNLFPGTAAARDLDGTRIASFGAGSGFLGIPGDVTPPSRFVRAAFYQASTPQKETGEETVLQCFQILNNFDIPIGIETAPGEEAVDLPSATQWTSATDVTNLKIYYRTMYDSKIRCFDLNGIDFRKAKYISSPLDNVRQQPIEYVKIK